MLLLSPSPFSKRSSSSFPALKSRSIRRGILFAIVIQFSPVSQLSVGSRGVNISSLPSFEIGSRGRSFSRSGKRSERKGSFERTTVPFLTPRGSPSGARKKERSRKGKGEYTATRPSSRRTIARRIEPDSERWSPKSRASPVSRFARRKLSRRRVGGLIPEMLP